MFYRLKMNRNINQIIHAESIVCQKMFIADNKKIIGMSAGLENGIQKVDDEIKAMRRMYIRIRKHCTSLYFEA